MTLEEQRIKLLEFLGWKDLKKIQLNALRGTSPERNKNTIAPNPLRSLNAIQILKENIVKDLKTRVKWIGILRDIVSRRMPKNKVGSPMTSDIDLHFATCEEHVEALLRTIGKWESK